MKREFTGLLILDTEDSGAAKHGRIGDDKETGMFVQVQSWDEKKEHVEIAPFAGKKVKVTIEVID